MGVAPTRLRGEVSVEVVRGSHRWNATYAPLAGRDANQDEDAREHFDGATDDAPVLGRDAYERWSYFSGGSRPVATTGA